MTSEQFFYVLLGGGLALTLAAAASQATEALVVPPLERPGPMSWLAMSLLIAAFLCLTGMMALHWSGTVL